uniref:Uncharacterized protein n=1 Tax=Arundo donax TaxID=35708 RepID=A0A0A9H646_ARUDO
MDGKATAPIGPWSTVGVANP